MRSLYGLNDSSSYDANRQLRVDAKRWLGAGVALTAALAATVACGKSTPVQPTTSVERGSVSTAVSASA